MVLIKPFRKSSPTKFGGKKRAVNAENNQFIELSRGGKTTKIHAVVDGLGNPIHFMLRKGEVADCDVAIALLSSIEIRGSNILADKIYGTTQIREYIKSQNAKYTIPLKSNTIKKWHCDFWLYKRL